MAEAIGVVSGVITFIDAGKKVLDLCMRIKDAPEKIAAYQQHLEDGLFNVENLKQRLQSNANPNISIARKDLDFVDNLLVRCTEHLLALQQILGDLDNGFKGGRRRHAWASLVAVRRSGEILGNFSKLQNGLNSLKSFLVQQNFWMLQGQSSAIAAVQTSLADLTAIQSQNTQGLEQSFAATSQRSAKYIVQGLDRMLQYQTSEIIPKLDAIYAVAARQVQMDAAQIGPPTQTMSQNHHLPISGVRSASARRCTCKTRPAPTYRSFGAFYYQDRTKNLHESTCPLREKSAREVSLGLKMAIPALFSKVVQLVVSAKFGAGGISISPAIKFPATIVDRTESEGFLLLDSLVREYEYKSIRPFDAVTTPEMEIHRLYHVLESFCESVTTHLFPLLESGSVSAHDQDVDGETLLWVFFKAVILANDSSHLSRSRSECVCKVIEMMINYFESDANAIVRSRTIMDTNIDASNYWTLRESEVSSHLGERLLQYGCEPYAFTASSSSHQNDLKTTFWSFRCPELAFDFGFPDHYQPIFNKSLDRLDTLIEKGIDWNKDEPGIPPAICACALGWPEGLRSLLQASVNPRPLFGPSQVWCEDAVPVLISEKCPPFLQPIPGSRQSVLAEVSMLEQLEDVTPNKRTLILDYVVQSRLELARQGLKHLPYKSPERNHIVTMHKNGYLLDELALSVWEALKERQVEIPEYLFPGKRPSVYFWLLRKWPSRSKSRARYDFLFDSGFTNVNIRDEDGRTAFWHACSTLDHAFTDFLASKGAEINPDAHRMYLAKIHTHMYSSPVLPDWLFALEPQITRDGCQCSCSSRGCTPVNILAKHSDLGHTSRRMLLSVYVSRLRSEVQEESWLEACRLEMFERLGMIHTCCEKTRWNFECICNQVSIGPGDDGQHLGYVLETIVLIYTKLRARFGGDLSDFLRAWWAAVDLFLPRDDKYDLLTSWLAKPMPRSISMHIAVRKLHRSIDEFDEARIWTVVKYYFVVVGSVTELFDCEINGVELHPKCSDAQKNSLQRTLSVLAPAGYSTSNHRMAEWKQ